MNKIIIFIISFLFGLIFIVDYFIWNPIQTVKEQVKITPIPENNLDPKELLDTPPGLSVQGKILNMSGDVQWESRAATEFSQITHPQTLQQGEAVRTGTNSLVELSFGENTSLNVGETSEIDFIQMLQDHFVFKQMSGTVIYTNTKTVPISVKTSSIIVLLSEGEMKITMDKEGKTVAVTMNKGTAQIAYNNADFVSQIVNISQGDVFVYTIAKRKGKVL
jgi:hypothetical protein